MTRHPSLSPALVGRLLLPFFALVVLAAFAGPAPAQNSIPAQNSVPAQNFVQAQNSLQDQTSNPTEDAFATADALARLSILHRSPLAPPDVASPRATLDSFLDSVGQGTGLLVAAYRENLREDSLFASEAVRERLDRTRLYFAKAAETFDFSEVPDSHLASTRLEAVLLLQEILARLPLPPRSAIPGLEAVQRGEVGRGWRLPATRIELIRVEEGRVAPAFLFSPRTIDLLEDLYAAVQELPPADPQHIDLYAEYLAAPGLLQRPKLFWLTERLPPSFKTLYGSQALWQWIAFVLFTLILAAALVGIWRRYGPAGATAWQDRSLWRRLALPCGLLLAIIAWLVLQRDVVNISGDLLRLIQVLADLLGFLIVAFIVLMLANTLALQVSRLPRQSPDSIDANFVRLAFRLGGLVIAAVVLVHGLTRIGVPLYGVVAGLGIGGVAIALAVRPTLENIVGGIVLYVDRPVRVGDFCQFGEMMGTVEQIGMRSTRIRALDETQVTIQNADFSQMRIVNYSRRRKMLFQHRLRLRYNTRAADLADVLTAIKELLAGDDRLDPDDQRVRLVALNDDSFGIEVRAMVLTIDHATFLEIQEQLIMRIIGIVRQNRTDFAVPSRTIYTASDPGLPGPGAKDAATQAAGN